MSYFSKLQQNVVVSAGNSSVAALGGGDTFTGPSTLPTAQSTLGVAGIQVNLFTNQNCTVYVDQSMEGTNWDVTDTFSYYAALGGNSWTVQATASYVRVRITNLNASVQASPFRLQTALCPIVESIPRALSAAGNLKTAVNEIVGSYGTAVEATPQYALRVAESTRLVGTTFGAVFDTNFWTKTTNTGTSTSTVADDTMTLQTNPTGSGSGNSAIVNSKRTARYVSGKSNYCRLMIASPTTVGENIKRWGVFDANNGYYFKWDGTTFYVGCRKGTSDTDVPSGSFNGKLGSTYTPTTNITVYEITWTNRTVWFLVGGIVLHSVTAASARLTNTTHLKVGLENTNGANTNNNTLNCLVASINRNGHLVTQPTFTNINGVSTTYILKYGPGNLHSIVFNSMPTTSGTLNIYDGISAAGILIGAVKCQTSAQINTPFSVDYKGLAFSDGLCIVTDGNPPNVTVIYE
jgi:hypothetical protein